MTRFDGPLENGAGSLTPPKPKWNFVKPWDRHGLILATAGMAYVLIGTAFMISEDTQARNASLKYIINLMPYDWWCVLFIAVGFVSILSARWPSKPRTLGYATLTGWTAAWAGFYILGGLSERNWAYVAVGFVWAIMAFLWWAISGLICPPIERGSRGNTSPHRHYHSCLDCCTISNSDTTGSFESES